jgi:hypothetical protein
MIEPLFSTLEVKHCARCYGRLDPFTAMTDVSGLLWCPNCWRLWQEELSAAAPVNAGYEPASVSSPSLRGRSAWSDQEPHKLPVAGSNPAPATNLMAGCEAKNSSCAGGAELSPVLHKHLPADNRQPATNLSAGHRLRSFFWLVWGKVRIDKRNRRGRRLHRWLALNGSVRRVA